MPVKDRDASSALIFLLQTGFYGHTPFSYILIFFLGGKGLFQLEQEGRVTKQYTQKIFTVLTKKITSRQICHMNALENTQLQIAITGR